MTVKQGIITMAEAADSREKAIEIGSEVKKKFSNLIPRRIDKNTVILIRQEQNSSEQIECFLSKLEKDRKNH